MPESSQGFIIDLYNKHAINNNVVSVFKIHGINFCIRKIQEFEWGQPIFPEKDIEDNYTQYHVYQTLEEAQQYIRFLKQTEGIL